MDIAGRAPPSLLRVLLLALDNWPGTARLPEALHRVGFQVGLVGCPDSFVALSGFLSSAALIEPRRNQRKRLAEICRAIDAFEPDCIVAADEKSSRLAHFLAASRPEMLSVSSQNALKRSLAGIGSLQAVETRHEVLRRAAALGINCPPNRKVESLRDALAFQAAHGGKVMLKRDHSFGGIGVLPCTTPAELRAAFNRLARSPTPLISFGGVRQTICRLLFGADRTEPSRITTSIESEIPGSPAFYTAVALDGRLLAGVSAEATMRHPQPTGPSTRVLLHHDAQMEASARRLIADFGFSGFCGLDFIRRPDGALALLEFNRRPTPIAHLGGLVGADLCEALHAGLCGAVPPEPDHNARQNVVLYPQDWLRAPAADDRDDQFCDIPRDEPAILAATQARIAKAHASRPPNR